MALLRHERQSYKAPHNLGVARIEYRGRLRDGIEPRQQRHKIVDGFLDLRFKLTPLVARQGRLAGFGSESFEACAQYANCIGIIHAFSASRDATPSPITRANSTGTALPSWRMDSVQEPCKR